MLIIDVELLHGTYRADPDGSAHTGNQQQGEWPPSPARLFAALVAADGTRTECRHTDGTELEWLESQSPPLIEASPGTEVTETTLNSRYVVLQDKTFARDQKTRLVQTTQEYVGRSGALVRPGIRVSPRCATVRFTWVEDPPDLVLRHLRLRCARIGYLGCADSPVRVSARTGAGGEGPIRDGGRADAAGLYQPSEDGELLIAGVEVGMTARLDAHFDRWRENGPSVRRAQSPGLRRLVRYTGPEALRDASVERQAQPEVLWLRLDRPISGRRVVALTDALRSTVLSRLDALGHEAPPVLHGHGFSGSGHDTARYLALPNVGAPRSDGRIHGMAVWLPAGGDPGVVEMLREALGRGARLHGRGFAARVVPWAGETRPWSSAPTRWTVTAHRWSSAFPVVQERSGRTVDLEEINRWCAHAGLPRAVEFRAERSPLLVGAVDLAPSEVNRPGRPKRSYCHIELVFDEAVQGPIALGAGRQFGLGLLAPVPEQS